MATSKDFRVKNGLVVEQDISFGGSFKDLSGNPIQLGGTSSDTYTVKDALILQQGITDLGTVVSKSTIPPTSVPLSYTGTGNPSSTNVIYSVLNYNYGYFYSSSADIYSVVSGTDKIRELFAPGNVVRITKDGFWWDLTITSIPSYSSSYVNINYNVSNYSSGAYTSPSMYNSYFEWSQNISFSTNILIAQKYVLNLNDAAVALTLDDKLLINGSENDTPYLLSTSTRGTWDIAITNGGDSYEVVFGSNTYYSNTADIRKLLRVGNTVTISDNTWFTSGVYLITEVGSDNVWASANGLRVKFQYVSGANYPAQYTSLSGIFSSYFASASATLTPNYTIDYVEDRFSEISGNSYVSFENYDFLDVGDVLTYIPATTSIKFKDDAGNNIKAITYNNNTSEMSYDGIVQTISIDSSNNILSLNSNTTLSTYSNTVVLGNNAKANGNQVIAIGQNSQAGPSGVAIGENTNSASVYGVAIGVQAGTSTFGTAVGYYAYASSGIAIGSNSYSTSGIGIGPSAYSSATSSIAIGTNANASHTSQITFSSSTNSSYINQISTVFWSDANLTRNGLTYLFANSGASSSTQSTANGSSTYSVDVAGRFSKNQRMMLMGTATIMIKPTNDQNDDDCKVVEMKMVIRSTDSNTFILEPISTTTVFAGTGTLHPNWTPAFELLNNRYLHFKFDKGSDTTALGIVCKLDFQVLHTA